jgi:hypothetical protein
LKQIGIQFTNRCHGRCIMCDNRLSSRAGQYMSSDQLHKVVNEIVELGANSRTAPTGICGDGEAVFHPDFKDMVPIVAEKLHWCFGSNCHAMSPEKTEVILENRPCSVNLSIDAVSVETLKQVRPGVNLDIAEHHARTFVEETRQRESWDRNFYVQFVVMKQNVHELLPWIDKWLPLIDGIPGFQLHIKPVFRWPRISEEEARSFWPSPPLPELPVHSQIHVDHMVQPPVRPTCRLLWDFCWILSNGAYNPCCMCADDVWEVGNVFESSIKACYTSRKLESYRRLMEQKRYDELPLCGRCV